MLTAGLAMVVGSPCCAPSPLRSIPIAVPVVHSPTHRPHPVPAGPNVRPQLCLHHSIRVQSVQFPPHTVNHPPPHTHTGRSLSLLDPTYASRFIPIIASVSEHQPPSWTSYINDLFMLVGAEWCGALAPAPAPTFFVALPACALWCALAHGSWHTANCYTNRAPPATLSALGVHAHTRPPPAILRSQQPLPHSEFGGHANSLLTCMYSCTRRMKASGHSHRCHRLTRGEWPKRIGAHGS